MGVPASESALAWHKQQNSCAPPSHSSGVCADVGDFGTRQVYVSAISFRTVGYHGKTKGTVRRWVLIETLPLSVRYLATQSPDRLRFENGGDGPVESGDNKASILRSLGAAQHLTGLTPLIALLICGVVLCGLLYIVRAP